MNQKYWFPKVPWGTELKTHPLISLMKKAPRKKMVTYIYNYLISYTPIESAIYSSWEEDINLGTETIDWDTVWGNVFRSSQNPNHHFIHYKICHRTYLTPRKRHMMGLAPNPYCTFCSQGVLGTLMHDVGMSRCTKVLGWSGGKVISSVREETPTRTSITPFKWRLQVSDHEG